jgi:hypothetical protein
MCVCGQLAAMIYTDIYTVKKNKCILSFSRSRNEIETHWKMKGLWHSDILALGWQFLTIFMIMIAI